MAIFSNPEIIVYVGNVDRSLIVAAQSVLLNGPHIIHEQEFRMQFAALTFKLQLCFDHQEYINNIIYSL
jgi:hypothetical protein